MRPQEAHLLRKVSKSNVLQKNFEQKTAYLFIVYQIETALISIQFKFFIRYIWQQQNITSYFHSFCFSSGIGLFCYSLCRSNLIKKWKSTQVFARSFSDAHLLSKYFLATHKWLDFDGI